MSHSWHLRVMRRLGACWFVWMAACDREQYFGFAVSAPQCRQVFMTQNTAYCSLFISLMKNLSLPLLLATSFLFSQCAKKAPEPTPQVDYDQKSAEIVQAVSPLVVGDWTLRRVHFKAQPYNTGQRELGIKRDTVFQDFATLSIQRAPSRYSSGDPRYPHFTGFLRYRTKTYPIQFELSASPQRLFHDEGPQAFFLFEFNFPVGSHPTEPEEQLLQYLGLMGENFSLEVLPGQLSMMTWKGLNRGIEKIEMVK